MRVLLTALVFSFAMIASASAQAPAPMACPEGMGTCKGSPGMCMPAGATCPDGKKATMAKQKGGKKKHAKRGKKMKKKS